LRETLKHLKTGERELQMRFGAQARYLHGAKSLAGSDNKEAGSDHPKVSLIHVSNEVSYESFGSFPVPGFFLFSGSGARRPLRAGSRDDARSDLERDSLHNLEVAKNYFKLKKAYVAALKRCEEIIAGNPNFAKIDEVLLMAGQSSVWLSQNKGKQNSSLYVSFDGGEKRTLTSEQFREMGRDYLKKLVAEYPNSSYAKEAQEELRALDAPAPKP
jgi:hypothetical protein